VLFDILTLLIDVLTTPAPRRPEGSAPTRAILSADASLMMWRECSR
jgi:hypothetical protein